MICEGYIRKLTENMKADWNCKIDDPYKVLEDEVEMLNNARILLDLGDDYFNDGRQIDWGSYAWRCSKTELEKFIKEKNIIFKNELKLVDGVEYGVLFVESGFCSEDFFE